MTIVILTNILTPYRKYFYEEIYKECKSKNINFYVVLMASTEEGRPWIYESFKTNYTELLPFKTIKIANIEIHLNRGLKKLYERIQPTVVICGGSYLYPSVWQTIKLSKKMGFKIVEWSESHLNEERNYGHLKMRLRNLIRKKIISKFDTFWCAGKFAQEFVSKYAFPHSKYIFTPNLIDYKLFLNSQKYSEMDKIEIRKKYDIDLNKKVFFTPARLIHVKGILEFLEIYKKCKINKCTYVIAGDGELKEEIVNYIKDNNLDVKLVGQKSEMEMIELYSISTGFILPSLSDPNPLSCIEACWCKLPLLVSTHVGNYPEIIQVGKNGYVFDYNDSNKNLETINTYLNHSDEWYANAGEISFQIANKIYNSKTVVPRVISETLINVESCDKDD